MHDSNGLFLSPLCTAPDKEGMNLRYGPFYIALQKYMKSKTFKIYFNPANLMGNLINLASHPAGSCVMEVCSEGNVLATMVDLSKYFCGGYAKLITLTISWIVNYYFFIYIICYIYFFYLKPLAPTYTASAQQICLYTKIKIARHMLHIVKEARAIIPGH